MNEGILGGFGGLLTTTPNRLIKETRYTSGTGNHQFREVTNYVKVILIGGGGSGAVGDGGAGGSTGGSGAETVIYDGPFIFTSRTVLYEVGAGGAAVVNTKAGLAGSRTRLDLLFAMPGRGGAQASGGAIIVGTSVPTGGGADIESTSAGNTGIYGILRIPGGAAGVSTNTGFPTHAGGKAAGFPFGFNSVSIHNQQYIVNTGSASSYYASGGGSSLLGLGGSGHDTNGLPGTGYGAGGGAARSATGTSGAGSGGIIIIMEYLQ